MVEIGSFGNLVVVGLICCEFSESNGFCLIWVSDILMWDLVISVLKYFESVICC